MTTVSHVVHVSTSVLQVLFLKAKSIQLTQMSAQNVVLVQMFVLTKQSAFHKDTGKIRQIKIIATTLLGCRFFCFHYTILIIKGCERVFLRFWWTVASCVVFVLAYLKIVLFVAKINKIEKFCLMIYKAWYSFSLVNEKGKEKNQIVFIHKTRLLMKKFYVTLVASFLIATSFA